MLDGAGIEKKNICVRDRSQILAKGVDANENSLRKFFDLPTETSKKFRAPFAMNIVGQPHEKSCKLKKKKKKKKRWFFHPPPPQG